MPGHNCLDMKSTYASRLGANDRFIFILSHLFPFLILSAHMFLKPNSADEGEHLHQAFMVGSGLKPYHDFFEHHMPVVWYVFSPIALFPGFISKIVFYKSMQMLVLALCMYLLVRSFPGSSRWTTWAFVLFLLFLAPFVDYIDLRPEFMAYPFVILVTALILRNPAFSMLSAVLLGALCGIELFVSPRAYAFILVFGLFFLSGPHTLRHKAVFVGAGALVALSVALYLGIANILFFVFEITRTVTPLPFEKLYYNPFLLRFTVVFMPVCMLLQLYGLKSSHLFLFALNVLQILLWFSEKLPYHGQSTALMMMMNFVFIFHLLVDRSGSFNLKLAGFGAVSLIVAFFTYRRNIYQRITFFKVESVYEGKLRKCEGKTYQSHSMGSMIRPGMEERIHPLFIRDYTYFGYFQDHLLLHNFERIIEHNKGRGVEYFSSVEPCHVDTMVARILREKFPTEKIISPPSE